MKKAILSIALLLSLTVSFADEKDSKSTAKSGNVAENVLRQFAYNFYNATDVKWNINEKFQTASFKLNDKPAYALYSLQNEFLVATQIIKTEEFSKTALKNINDTYAGAKIQKIVKIISRPSDFQFSDDTGSYWVSLISGEKQIILLVTPEDNITTVTSIKL
jgi:hypothetical protein